MPNAVMTAAFLDCDKAVFTMIAKSGPGVATAKKCMDAMIKNEMRIVCVDMVIIYSNVTDG